MCATEISERRRLGFLRIHYRDYTRQDHVRLVNPSSARCALHNANYPDREKGPQEYTREDGQRAEESRLGVR